MLKVNVGGKSIKEQLLVTSVRIFEVSCAVFMTDYRQWMARTERKHSVKLFTLDFCFVLRCVDRIIRRLISIRSVIQSMAIKMTRCASHGLTKRQKSMKRISHESTLRRTFSPRTNTQVFFFRFSFYHCRHADQPLPYKRRCIFSLNSPTFGRHLPRSTGQRRRNKYLSLPLRVFSSVKSPSGSKSDFPSADSLSNR